jgi:hypothetical protein
MPEDTTWVTLYHPDQQAWHRVPDSPVVIQDFQDRGWETPDESAARFNADASQLHGKELEDALQEAGLPRSGTVKQKQARLAEHRQAQAPAEPQPTEPYDPLTEVDETPTAQTEGEQG